MVKNASNFFEVKDDDDWDERVKPKVISSPRVMIFSASWCGPCRAYKIAWKNFIKEFPGVNFIYIDVDNAEELVEQYDVVPVPTTFVYKNPVGTPVKITGAAPADLKRHLMQIQGSSLANQNSNDSNSPKVCKPSKKKIIENGIPIAAPKKTTKNGTVIVLKNRKTKPVNAKRGNAKAKAGSPKSPSNMRSNTGSPRSPSKPKSPTKPRAVKMTII